MYSVGNGATSVRALLARRELDLTLVLPENDLPPHALDQSIRWVHTSDLTDPTPFLSNGLALLTTGTQFDEDAKVDVYLDYVRRLRDRGVHALGFGTEVIRDGVPPGLITACHVHGLPLFEVPYRTPFIAVARANAEGVAAQEYARQTWALDAQLAISLAALRPAGLTAILSELSRQMDAWVGLFNAAGRLTREHPSGTLSVEAADAIGREVTRMLHRQTRTGSTLQLGESTFTLQTLGNGKRLRGVLVVSDSRLDRESRGVLTSVIAMTGLALEQNRETAQARAALRAGVVHLLSADESNLALRIARLAWGGLPREPILVARVVASGRHDDITEWLESQMFDRPAALFFARRGPDLLIVTPATDRGTSQRVSERFGVRIGVSAPARYSEFSSALRNAAIALDRGSEAVSWFTDLATSGILTLLNSEPGLAVASEVLRPLIASDALTGSALIRTTKTWLECDAQYSRAAEMLNVHRHTVRTRIEQAQKLLNLNLDSFAARAELWAALRALG